MPTRSLTRVFGQSTRIYDLLQQARKELGPVNPAGKHGLAHIGPVPRTNDAAPDNIGSIGRLLKEAAESLKAVNQTLQIEIRDRTMINYQLAAAVEQQEGARNVALHDQLTGLPNRVLFNDRLEHGIAQAKRHQWILAVMFVDLNKFKNINDTHGHQAGDAVLRAVATRLSYHARTDDTVSRYGGDEFLYLLTPLQEQTDVAIIAAKTLKALKEPCEVRAGHAIVKLSLGASIGISVFPKDGDNAADLINRADEAMYRAKANRSGFAFAQ